MENYPSDVSRFLKHSGDRRLGATRGDQLTLPASESSQFKLLGEMSWVEVEQLLSRTKTVVMAAGSVEQHGPHLPLLSDYYQGDDLIRRVVRFLSDNGVAVAGGFSISFAPAEDAMQFAGSISISSITYMNLISETLESLRQHGFRRFPFIVCHEQVMGPLMAVVREFNARHIDSVAGVLTGWAQAAISSVRKQLCTGERPEQDGHAGELETSRMLVVRPELVNMSQAGTHYPPAKPPIPHSSYPFTGGGLYEPVNDFRTLGPNGYVGAAAEATVEKGETSIRLAVEWICEVIKRDFLA